MILLAYDGSDNAKDAIKRAGALFKGQPAVVLFIWEQYAEIVARAPAGFARSADSPDYQRLDEASSKYGEEEAEAGAALAREAGLEAMPRTAPRMGATAETILNEAEAVNADAIVLGSRGRGGIGTFLLGSVSHALLQSADRPVLVVPSPEVARQRAEKLRGRRS
jgi:nucleotide-binding universal stress UspA family protein